MKQQRAGHAARGWDPQPVHLDWGTCFGGSDIAPLVPRPVDRRWHYIKEAELSAAVSRWFLCFKRWRREQEGDGLGGCWAQAGATQRVGGSDDKELLGTV